jgi:hypothetical protein
LSAVRPRAVCSRSSRWCTGCPRSAIPA